MFYYDKLGKRLIWYEKLVDLHGGLNAYPGDLGWIGEWEGINVYTYPRIKKMTKIMSYWESLKKEWAIIVEGILNVRPFIVRVHVARWTRVKNLFRHIGNAFRLKAGKPVVTDEIASSQTPRNDGELDDGDDLKCYTIFWFYGKTSNWPHTIEITGTKKAKQMKREIMKRNKESVVIVSVGHSPTHTTFSLPTLRYAEPKNWEDFIAKTK